MALFRKYRQKRRRRMARKSYRRRGAGLRSFRGSRTYPFVLLGGAAAGLIAAVLLVLFLLVPALSGQPKSDPDAIVPGKFVDPETGTEADIKENDLSSLQNEAVIQYKTINDAYLCGEEIVFSSASVRDGVAFYDKLVVYNTATQESQEISGINVKYDNIVWTRLTPDFLVWVDSNDDGGGRIMLYNRAEGKSYLVKEYAYALPQISVSGEYLAFWQQAGESIDRLYLYHMPTREGVAVKVYDGMDSVTGSAHVSEGGLVYAVPYMENEIQKCRIYVQPLDGGAEVAYEPGRYAYSPKMNGNYIAFLSSTSGPPRDIYLMEKGGETKLIESGVLNFDMGQDFLAYTKDQNVYIHVFATGQKYRLNTDISRGRLASVCGDMVAWYDVTSESDVDVVKYAKAVW